MIDSEISPERQQAQIEQARSIQAAKIAARAHNVASSAHDASPPP
ncbi:MAG: hypothetical protein WDO69_22730 [Pseudomonadota bacterium]